MTKLGITTFWALLFASFFPKLFAEEAAHLRALPGLKSESETQSQETQWKIYPFSVDPQKNPTQVLRSDRAGSVVAIQNQNQAVKDSSGKVLNPYVGADLEQWPGVRTLRARFDKLEMPTNSPYREPWFFEKNIDVPTFDRQTEKIWLDLSGVNYRARLFLNGSEIKSTDLVGPYRDHNIDITNFVKVGSNHMKFLVEAPPVGQLGYSWIDWHASPPDKMMGILEEPVVVKTGILRVMNPMVKTQYDAINDVADVSLSFEVKNLSTKHENAIVEVELAGKKFLLNLNAIPKTTAGEPSSVTLSSKDFPQLRFVKPELWWPRGMGDPRLHSLSIQLKAPETGKLLSALEKKVGFREIKGYLNANNDREFLINGEPLQVRGVGWSGDFTLTEAPEKKIRKLQMVSDMGYNSIRQEGSIESNAFYEKADEMGIMVLAGLPCCGNWESDEAGKVWKTIEDFKWTPEKYIIAEESMKSLMKKLRQHPSFLAWFNGSDLRLMKRSKKDMHKFTKIFSKIPTTTR